MTQHRFIAVFVSALSLAACGGGGSGGSTSGTSSSAGGSGAAGGATTVTGSGTVAPCPATDTGLTAPIILSGTLTFDKVPHNTLTNGLDYANTLQQAARGITVEAIDSAGAILANTVTDAAGAYSFSVPGSTQLRVRAKAEMLQTTGSNSGPSWNIRVTDNTDGNALYALQGVLASSCEADQIRDLNAASGWGGSSYTATRAAAPFAILDPIYDSVQKFVQVDPDIVFPPVEFRWSVNNNPASGNLTDGDIGTSFYQNGAIYLLGAAGSDTDEYDSHVVTHEWGHYFEDNLSRSDSVGGPHTDGDRLDPRVAFGEGFGNALSGMMLDDPSYRDSLGSAQTQGFENNVEDNSYGAVKGWFNEGSVQSILYDIYDSADEGADALTLGLAPIYDTLTAPDYIGTEAFTSIFPFIDQLKTLAPGNDAAIDALLTAQSIDGSGIYGADESNDGTVSSALPIYNTLTPNGSAVLICSVNDEGSFNKLGVRAWLNIDITTSGSYSMSMSRVNGATGRDPDFVIYQAGSFIDASESSATNSETWNGTLTAGRYVIDAYDYENTLDSNTGDACYNFVVTQ